MVEEGNKEIAIVSEETIKDKIYFIRGQKVMVDSDLAEIYGYSTRAFNARVSERFWSRLTRTNLNLVSRSKIFT